jgi:hypothetical protein
MKSQSQQDGMLLVGRPGDCFGRGLDGARAGSDVAANELAVRCISATRSGTARRFSSSQENG